MILQIPKEKIGFKTLLYQMLWSDNLDKFPEFDEQVGKGYLYNYGAERVAFIYDGLVWAIENSEALDFKDIFSDLRMPKELVLTHFKRTVSGMELYCNCK